MARRAKPSDPKLTDHPHAVYFGGIGVVVAALVSLAIVLCWPLLGWMSLGAGGLRRVHR